MCGLQASALGSFARADSHQLPEIIWAPGKTPGQNCTAMRQVAAADQIVLAVRVEPDVAAAVLRDIPEAVFIEKARALR